MDTRQPAPGIAPASTSRAIAPSLFLTALIYGGMVVLAGVLGFKQVALGPLAVEAGIFAFLLLVVMSSATAELHGRAVANRLVLWGFVPLFLSVALIFVVLQLPPSAEMAPDRLAAFATVLGQSIRILLAGPLAYGISQFLNVYIFDRLRGDNPKGGGAGLMVRGAIAGALSQAVDTVIFITAAFYGVFPILDLLVGQMIAKVSLSLVLVPFLIQGAVTLGRRMDAKAAA